MATQAQITATQQATPTWLDNYLASQQDPNANAAVPAQTNGTVTVQAPRGNNQGVQAPPPATTATVRNPQAVPLATAISAMPGLTMTPTGVSQDSPGATQDYNNSSDATAVHDALNASPAQGGSPNPGIYGLLPQGLQHGTLRNVLGALGDAFLVGSGHQPSYASNMQRQSEGNALAGMNISDPTSVSAAVQRLAATGAPGAADLAAKLFDTNQTLQYNQNYRNQMIGVRNQGVFDRMVPMAQGMVSAAKTQDDYAARYDVLDKRAKAVDPQADASSAFGIPTPDEWSETPGYGMTSNQQQESQDKAAGRAQSGANAETAATSRVKAAGIGAQGHVAAAGVSNLRPSPTTYLEQLIDKQKSGQQLSPAEQNYIARMTTPTGRGARAPLIGVGGQGGAGAPKGILATARGPNGQTIGWTGQHWVDTKTGAVVQ